MADNEVRNRKKIGIVDSDDSLPPFKKEPAAPPRFGPLPSFPYQRVWARIVLIICASVIVYFTAKRDRETVLASQKDVFERRGHNIVCSESYKLEVANFKGCVPKYCGRVISDTLLTDTEVETLLNMAKTGISLRGSDGGASILDLHSGALSHGQSFVNFYKLPESSQIFKPKDYVVYTAVKNKISQALAEHFGIQQKSIYLTHPTFFSRLTNTPPKTIHDEYWHKHIDKETYESFHYTSLVYLNDYKKDFNGGRFLFVNVNNSTTVVEPKKGRVSMFTSGAENPHYVEKVSSGVRYAITVSFTCDSSKAIKDLKPPALT